MHRVNHLNGFNGRRPLPTVRYVGSYNVTFGGNPTASFNIPDADLSPSSAERQLLIACPGVTSAITQATIGGVTATPFTRRDGLGATFFSAFVNSDGPVAVVMSNGAATSDDIAAMVFEVDHAAPLKQGQAVAASGTATAITLPTARLPPGATAVAMAHGAADANTFTWGTLTEVADADEGDDRLAVAVLGRNVAGVTEIAEVITASGSTTIFGQLIPILPKSGVPSGRLLDVFGGTAVTTTLDAREAFIAGQGRIKLVVVAQTEADATTITASFDGVTMSVAGSVNNTGASPDLHTRIFHLDVDTDNLTNPAAAVIFGGLSLGVSIDYAIYSLSNLTKLGDVQSVSGNATGAALVLDVEEGGFIIAVTIRATDTQTVTWTGVEEAADLDAGPFRSSQAYRAQCAAEQNRAVQAVGSGSGQYSTLAVAFNP